MATDKLSFILGVHCHQPVGNFGWVIEDAFEKSYRPFIEALADYPTINVTAHYSGPLLEWILENRPEYLDTLRTLVEAGRMEIIGSGFYEPILMMIPMVDRLEQIEMMEQWVDDHLGMRPTGVWLTERIWEPALPRTLNNAHVDYTIADDSHFIQAGVPKDKIGGYYLTEDEGHRTAVFPIDQHLRYAVPFKSPEETVAYLRQRYDNGDRSCVTLIDDGEKFGVWPGTYDLLYGDERWLARFLELLSEQSDWLEITTPSRYLAKHDAEQLVYLPTTSYFEMGQWTLQPRDNLKIEELKHRMEDELQGRQEVFIKGGFFRNFFTRYPESNHMHKRMLEISNKVHLSALEGKPRDDAKRALYRAQCNCAFWHGIFGGLYLPHLRDAIYENLIAAEAIVEDRDMYADSYDLDVDGKEEVVLRNEKLAAVIAPADGGTLLELDSIAHNANLIDTLARREEAYHLTAEIGDGDGDAAASIHDMQRRLSEEDSRLLVYDAFRRTCFRDALLDGGELGPETLRDVDLSATDGGFAGLGYKTVLGENDEAVSATLAAETRTEQGLALRIEKTFTLTAQSDALNVRYRLTSTGKGSYNGTFAVQLNVSVPSALGIDSPFTIDGKLRAGHALLEPGRIDSAQRFSMRDPHRKFAAELAVDRPLAMVWHPLQTISQSESGFDRNYQATTLWALLPVSLSGQDEQELEFTLTVRDQRQA